MDPIAILGLVGSVSGIVSSISRTIKDLNDIRAKFSSTDVNIRLLIAELSTIKSALTQIHDWAAYNLTEKQEQRVGDSLETTLDGCGLAMEILAEDVAEILRIDILGHNGMVPRLGFRRKAQLIWNGNAIKDHQDRLSRQTAALQLLLMAVQCNSISEQSSLLREPENQQKIQDVADDTSTIHATRSQRGSTMSPSTWSGRTSLVSSTAFPWDEQLKETEAYRCATRQRNPGPAPHHDSNRQRPSLNIQLNTASADEGYETMSKTTSESALSVNHLSPVWDRGTSPRLVRPYETVRLRAAESGKFYPETRSPSDSAASVDHTPRQAQSPVHTAPNKLPRSKKSIWDTLRRKSDSALEDNINAQGDNGPTPGSSRGRRGFENRFHKSIDFASPDGMNCPAIVRAAQAGSTVEIESMLDAGAEVEECHQATGRNAMAVAAHCGNDEVVERLLRHGATTSKKDHIGCTPLHLAASRGHVGVMRILLSEYIPVEGKGPGEKTPLRLSCDNGHFEAAELLLAHKARVNARDDKNLTSLHAAAKRGDANIVDLLIRNGAHIEAKDANFMNALHHACEGGHNGVIELLLNKKAGLETPGSRNKTPLMTAAAAGFAHTVELLLKRKASLKTKGSGDMTALHWAACNGHVEVIDLLLQKKAPINAVNHNGRTPLHLAVMADHFPVVELLLRKNSAIEAQCTETFRPLHYACSSEHTDIVRLLLQSGANLEASTIKQDRPLHIAVTRGSLPIVNILLGSGAEVDVRNADGDRALLLASSHGHTAIVNSLLNWGAPVRSKFAAGPSHEDSPLCLAARNGCSDVVRFLISRGASVSDKDEHDWPPLRYGAYYGHPQVVEELLDAGASVSGIATWGFSLTADRIGFAQSVNISDECKQTVLLLLRSAEESEQRAHESQVTHPDASIYHQVEQVEGPVELTSSASRAGAGGRARRFSFDATSQKQEEVRRQGQLYSDVSSQQRNNSALYTNESLVASRPVPYSRVAHLPASNSYLGRTHSDSASSSYDKAQRGRDDIMAGIPGRSATSTKAHFAKKGNSHILSQHNALAPDVSPRHACPVHGPFTQTVPQAIPARLRSTTEKGTGSSVPDGIRMNMSPDNVTNAPYIYQPYSPDSFAEMSSPNVSGSPLLPPVSRGDNQFATSPSGLFEMAG
ncbi:hypothetical protein LTR46_008118 [Exophiala xenobiotica]|nr:hypothetical protein LTR46_008118 [Exophiala xenobiotica]